MFNKIAIYALAILISPTIHSSSAIGYYSNGSIKDSLEYSRETPFVHKLFKARMRLYSTEEMFRTIQDMDDFLSKDINGKESIQLGDLSNMNGGKASGHGSHQNGLDADFVYLTNDRKLQSSTASYWEEEFVVGNKISPNFDLVRNISLFQFLANKTPAARIFVDEVIKREICSFLSKSGEINLASMQIMLRKLRVENLHKTHYHLRLYCPMGDTSCVPQSEPPIGDGCDSFQMDVLDKIVKEKSC